VILVDTGPLVAIFDPRDAHHAPCAATLRGMTDRLISTEPVLTEAFHLLEPGTRGASLLQQFIRDSGLSLWTMDDKRLLRSLDVMEQYEDNGMDFADASLVAAAESLRITTIFTLDRKDFATYRPRIGRTLSRFRILQAG
jgi:hypothetical protein